MLASSSTYYWELGYWSMILFIDICYYPSQLSHTFQSGSQRCDRGAGSRRIRHRTWPRTPPGWRTPSRPSPGSPRRLWADLFTGNKTSSHGHRRFPSAHNAPWVVRNREQRATFSVLHRYLISNVCLLWLEEEQDISATRSFQYTIVNIVISTGASMTGKW